MSAPLSRHPGVNGCPSALEAVTCHTHTVITTDLHALHSGRTRMGVQVEPSATVVCPQVIGCVGLGKLPVSGLLFLSPVK